jgi:hypothetical protein
MDEMWSYYAVLREQSGLPSVRASEEMLRALSLILKSFDLLANTDWKGKANQIYV